MKDETTCRFCRWSDVMAAVLVYVHEYISEDQKNMSSCVVVVIYSS